MIRIEDPSRLGPALAEVRQLLGISRRELARTIAEATGRSETSVNAQIWGWETGHTQPTFPSIVPMLDALGYDLALTPREDA